MTFANPEAFWLIILLPLYFLLQKKSELPSQGLALPTLSILKSIKFSRAKIYLKAYSPVCLTIIAMILLITALARPRLGKETTKTIQKGIDIILALDISYSMLAEDFRPNRLEAAKKVISEFIQGQKGNRIGSVIFSGRSFTLMPLTTDYNLLRQSIEEVDYDMIKIQGTAIGDSIANALYRFKDNKTQSKIIILLTDGEHNVGKIKPLVATEMARKKDVKIYTIGVGKKEGFPIPAVDHRGKKTYLKDRYGNYILTRLNEDDLQKIASETGGLYFHADNANKLSNIYNLINKMEKTEFEVKKQMAYTERMSWFLWPAIALFLLAQFLSLTICRIIRLN